MIIGVPRETYPDETRVALTPETAGALAGREEITAVLIEHEAGAGAGFADAAYSEKGCTPIADRGELFTQADTVLQVRTLGANPEAGQVDLPHCRPDQVFIGLADALNPPPLLAELAQRGSSLLAMELMPRITRAQSMDVLSSMATLAGYKAVLLGAATLPRIFPLLMTAAGTLTPTRLLVLGAGVAGLQAIATARRLGAVVSAYDVRPAVAEQIQSLGAQFVDLGLETEQAEDTGGYATAQSDDFSQRQQEALSQVVAQNQVVIATAAIPGQPAPKLITAEAVAAMEPGSVIVDLAAETGGNCALTRPGETVVEHGVHILGPRSLPTTLPYHASRMYAHNISTFFQYLSESGTLHIDPENEITGATLVAHKGQIVHPQVSALIDAPRG
ncbi:MAG: NAD(P)(+) transhydrogenase (Re/Si-specific) subunit alpha [Candidatus Latescibacteria bacterium]|nr:NAD(P)(+) transhydrogenase (Re/Si-specific) subunit alpha [Candidatus Latescibacterota bacterium]